MIQLKLELVLAACALALGLLLHGPQAAWSELRDALRITGRREHLALAGAAMLLVAMALLGLGPGEAVRPLASAAIGTAAFTARLLAVRDDRFKLVVSSRTGEALYDVQEDPDEERDVSADHPARLTQPRAALERWRESQPAYRGDAKAAPGEGMSEAERQLLESLDYVAP
ncbi:MAG: hypothetical protein GY937_03810 [bacterium]|nr:hypothetical protein [bacterium]